MSTSQTNLWPRLVADIGGTNARFALETAAGQIERVDVLPCNDYNTVVDAIKEYLKRVGNPVVHHAAIAIANPIVGDWVARRNFSLRKYIMLQSFSKHQFSVCLR